MLRMGKIVGKFWRILENIAGFWSDHLKKFQKLDKFSKFWKILGHLEILKLQELGKSRKKIGYEISENHNVVYLCCGPADKTFKFQDFLNFVWNLSNF